MNRLVGFGNTPVTAAIVASVYPRISAMNKKMADMERKGELMRIKKGIYVVSPEITGCRLSNELIANTLCTPSYVSMFTSLRYYGLIPEAVYTQQSMTISHSKTIDTPIGRFEYTHISREAFPIGITRKTKGNAAFIIATPEKALCDLIAATSGLTLRYKNEAIRYLEEYLRFDMDYLEEMNGSILEEYIKVGKKPESIRTILRLL